MKNWTQTEMPDFMSVAFSSERSIEDELERESEAEVITVVISYAVMFVYIAVALGKFRSFKTLLVSRRCRPDAVSNACYTEVVNALGFQLLPFLAVTT
jgi:hypothetical protein